jgi:hypothetical protein
MSSLQVWINAALLVAEAEGMANAEVIPTWPADCVARFPDRFPQLTVGALREWQVTSAQDGGEPVAWLCIKPDGKPWGAVTNQGSVNAWMRQESLGRTVCPLYTHPPSAVVPDERGTNEYGLDMSYFRSLFNRELSSLKNFRPDELARVLARAARTADASVLQENEFQPSAVVPEGWKRVPLKPTSEMMFAPAFGAVTGTLKPSTFSDIYQAMIAAAPQPPEQEQES